LFLPNKLATARGDVAKSVDAPDLKSVGAIRAGSSPAVPTKASHYWPCNGDDKAYRSKLDLIDGRNYAFYFVG
jgi:hypothetical protein